MKLIVKWSLPIRTISEANCSQHWRVKYKRHQAQKYWIKAYFKNEQTKIPLPVHVKLTRYAPKSLDRHDNLPMSFKWIVDSVCETLIPGKAAGRSDDDKRISIEYDQVKSSEYRVVLEFFDPGTNSAR